MLRKTHGYRNLIIGLTGNALDDDVTAFLNSGADLVLAKPLRGHHLDALLAYIARYGFRSSRKYRLVMHNHSAIQASIERILRHGVATSSSHLSKKKPAPLGGSPGALRRLMRKSGETLVDRRSLEMGSDKSSEQWQSLRMGQEADHIAIDVLSPNPTMGRIV